MAHWVALILALLLSYTGPQFALARAPAGGGAVLCIGGGLAQVALDADGQPVGPGHYCPDCVACALPLAAVPVGQSAPARWHPVIWPQAGIAAGLVAPDQTHSARAPPVGV